MDYPDWRSFFERLTAEAAKAHWPGPVILDELPYLIAADPTITSVLQNWLDAPQPRPCLVVSGSSQQTMHGNLLDAGAPLYGRASEAFALRPLQPGFLQQAFPAAGMRELVSLHAVWGGMPRYWELAQPFGSALDAAVDTLVLDPAGALHDEPDRLLRAETPPATALRPLLDVIGAGAHRASEIGGRLGKPVSSLSRPLATLVAMNLVRREIPFGSDPKSGKRSLYRIDDPFLRLRLGGRCPIDSNRRLRHRESPAAPVRPELQASSVRRAKTQTRCGETRNTPRPHVLDAALAAGLRHRYRDLPERRPNRHSRARHPGARSTSKPQTRTGCSRTSPDVGLRPHPVSASSHPYRPYSADHTIRAVILPMLDTSDSPWRSSSGASRSGSRGNLPPSSIPA